MGTRASRGAIFAEGPSRSSMRTSALQSSVFPLACGDGNPFFAGLLQLRWVIHVDAFLSVRSQMLC